MSAENSGKPLGSLRGSDPLSGGEGAAAPSPRTPPRSQPSALQSCPLPTKNPEHAFALFVRRQERHPACKKSLAPAIPQGS